MKRFYKIIKKAILGSIVFYQYVISPFKQQSCRFYPSCSQYAYQAVTKYGIIKGIGKAIRRIVKCHPFHSGGYDPI